MARGEAEPAHDALRDVLAEAPNHVEALRLLAVAQQLLGRRAEALSVARRALALAPDNPLVLNTLGALLSESGDGNTALRLFRRVCELQPELASAWFNLGMNLQARGEIREAESVFARSLACDPAYVMAYVGHAGTLGMLGRSDEAAATYRAALRIDPSNVLAWAGLADLKTITLDARESALLAEVYARPDLADEQRAIAGFALARVLEQQQHYADAFAILQRANLTMHRQTPWDSAAHSRTIDAIADAFATPPRGNPDRSCGREVIFVTSLPRSGSTLVEQILGAHPGVEAAGELADLARIVQAESVRRSKPFPSWVGDARENDWARLGREYLERTAHWRGTKAVHVDKALFNWPLIGAICAMLPGAAIVDCQRDPLETGWSIYKQRFARGQQAFAYDFDDIGRYWIDHDRLLHYWHARWPGRIYELSYERLVAEPDTRIRSLLAFCGLPFSAACLRFDRSERVVRSASAAQVREPLRRDTARARHYGTLLDPLREALAIGDHG